MPDGVCCTVERSRAEPWQSDGAASNLLQWKAGAGTEREPPEAVRNLPGIDCCGF